MKRSITLFTLSLAFSLQLFAASPVWKVSKGGKHVYIGGTVHLLSKSDYPLPKAFDKAYGESRKLVFEVDISAVSSVDFATKLMTKNIYVGDDDITKHLKPDTAKKLEEFLNTRSMTLEPLKKMKPGFLSIMLATVEMQRLGMAESGVDQHYNDKALKDKKTIGALETADEQLNFISKMGEGKEDELILHTIEEMGKMKEVLDKMKKAWRTGDLKELEKVSLDDWKDQFPDVYKELLVDRNNNWMPQIKAMFKTKEVEFVLVGALHLAGDDGLFTQLKKSGYKVQQME